MKQQASVYVPEDKYVPSGQTQSLIDPAVDPALISNGLTQPEHLLLLRAAYNVSGVCLQLTHFVI